MTALYVFRIKEVEMDFNIYTEPKLHDPWVSTIITMRVRPSVSLSDSKAPIPLDSDSAIRFEILV